MQDLDSIRTWGEFGEALGEMVKLSNATLAEVGYGVIHRKTHGKVNRSCISRATYYRVLRGEARPPRDAVSGILRNIKVPPPDIERWLLCRDRLITEKAATAHIMAKVAARAEVLSDQVDSPGAAAQYLGELLLRRRGRLAAMRKSLGVNHPYVVAFGFDTACYVRALIDPAGVHRLLLSAIEQSVHEGHGRPRRFGTAEELMGQIDEYLMLVNVVEEELLLRDAASGYRAGSQHDPFQEDLVELRQATVEP